MALFVLKIAHMAISMESTPLLENGMHLRSPTPIMAPGLYTFSDRNSAKNIPFGATHTLMACIREYHPPGCIIPQREQVYVYSSMTFLVGEENLMRRVFYLFIFLFYLLLGSDMTIKLKLYFKILFRCEQNLSEESKMFTNVPYRRDHLRIVPKWKCSF